MFWKPLRTDVEVLRLLHCCRSKLKLSPIQDNTRLAGRIHRKIPQQSEQLRFRIWKAVKAPTASRVSRCFSVPTDSELTHRQCRQTVTWLRITTSLRAHFQPCSRFKWPFYLRQTEKSHQSAATKCRPAAHQGARWKRHTSPHDGALIFGLC